MTINWSSYVQHVKLWVNSCPDIIIEQQVLNAAIVFCQRSQIWRDDITAIDTVVGQSEYTIASAITGTRVITAVNVRYDTATILPKTEDFLDNYLDGWRNAVNGRPLYYFCPTPGKIKFNCPSDSVIVGGIKVRVALKPLPTATGADDQLYNDWFEEIAVGAKARLFGMRDKPWYDPGEQAKHDRAFSSAISRARARADHGNTRTNLTVALRAW